MRFFNYIKNIYGYFKSKRYTTISGTLAFFLILSIVPFVFWLSLIFGKVVNIEQVLELEILSGVKEMLSAMIESGKNAGNGVSIILIATTLYSSTNFFYHIRRSGEMIYDTKLQKGGIKLRLYALLLILVIMIVLICLTFILTFGKYLLNFVFLKWLSNLLTYLTLLVFLFVFALLINLFSMPFKVKFKNIVWGSLISTILWLIACVGFSVYLQISNAQKLYGAVSTIIIFMLWIYVLMICYTIGAIFNNILYNKIKFN